MAFLQKLTRAINRISLLCCLTAPLAAGDPSYLFTAGATRSFATPFVDGAAYGAAAEYSFTDFGGRFFLLGEKFSFGISTGLYSGTAGRTPLCRFAVGWIPLLAHVRKSFFSDLLFADLGTGAAYGIGAAEYFPNGSSAAYHKYSEGGWLTSLTLGAEWKFITGLGLQFFCEGAYLYARIRNPDLAQPGSIDASQWFLRPGLALALRF